MKITKFLSIAISITCLSLLYVYQQTEIFRLAYTGQKQQVVLDDLLDKNTILRYNIKRNASLVEIGSSASSCADYVMPETYRLVRLSTFPEGLKLTEEAANKQTLLSRLFGIKRQAEAQTINP